VNEALGAALGPTTWQEDFSQYVRSAVSEFVNLPGIKTAGTLTVQNVLQLEQVVAGSVQAFDAYKRSLDLALKVAASNQQVISSWATQAAIPCNPADAREAAPLRPDASKDFTAIGGFRGNCGAAPSGYEVELWRQGDILFGFFTDERIGEADFPTGLVEDASFEPPTGRISFKARLSLTPDESGFRRSHDLFEFSGKLEKDTLAGTVGHSVVGEPTKPEVSSVRLQRCWGPDSKDLSLRYWRVPTYGEWRKRADEILKFRGPRW
jgi:hypothetical protein